MPPVEPVTSDLCSRQTALSYCYVYGYRPPCLRCFFRMRDDALVNPIMRAQGASREIPFCYEVHRGALSPRCVGAGLNEACGAP